MSNISSLNFEEESHIIDKIEKKDNIVGLDDDDVNVKDDVAALDAEDETLNNIITLISEKGVKKTILKKYAIISNLIKTSFESDKTATELTLQIKKKKTFLKL